MTVNARAWRLLPALLISLVVLMTLGAAGAGAEVGGLGSLGSITAEKVCEGGVNEHVDPLNPHAFVVNPKDGSFFIADTYEVSGKLDLRIQKFAANGAFKAVVHFEPKGGVDAIGGLAIDPAKEEIYLLGLEQRPEENEAVATKISEDEAARERAKSKGELEKVKEDEKLIEQEEARLKAFDPGMQAAAGIYAYSTTTLAPLGTNGVLVNNAELQPGYESETEDKVPLLEPHGMTVDPTTHDLLIAGQEDVSSSKEEEELRTAVQRVHTGAGAEKLGARYLDNEDCLDEANESVHSEPACGEGAGEPSSPIVLPNGHVVVEQEQELWEVPDTQGIGETARYAYQLKPYDVGPKRLYKLAGPGSVVTFGRETPESGGSQAEFVPSSTPGTGKIYLAGDAAGNYPAVVELSYEQSAEHPISELGWTGGQAPTGENARCQAPLGSTNVLAGGDEEGHGLLFATVAETKTASGQVAVLHFGEGGEGCGHATASPPTMIVKNAHAETVELGNEASFQVEVTGANARSTEWTLENETTKVKQPVVTTGFGEQQPELPPRELTEPGKYKVIAKVQPDDFGPVLTSETTITVVAPPVTVSLSAKPGVETASFTAHVHDPYEAGGPHLKYVWQFGDGTKAESETKSTEVSVEHHYAPGTYHVKLEVVDASKHSAVAENAVTVTAPPPPPTTTTSPPPPPPTTTNNAPPPKKEVLSYAVAHLASSSVSVNTSGAVPIKVSCGAGTVACTGTVLLRTLTAVSTSSHKGKKGKKAILTLASVSFTVAPGQTKTVMLHLSSAGKTLLAKLHTLHVSAATTTHLASGTQTTQGVVTLRLVKAHKKKKH